MTLGVQTTLVDILVEQIYSSQASFRSLRIATAPSVAIVLITEMDAISLPSVVGDYSSIPPISLREPH